MRQRQRRLQTMGENWLRMHPCRLTVVAQREDFAITGLIRLIFPFSPYLRVHRP
jgi:hypothetical protein